MGKIVTKVTSAIITAILVFSNLLVLGGEVIAYGGELENQNAKTNNSKVEFNSYFEGGMHGKEFNATEEGKIYLNLKVKDEGYLKDIIVNFSNANFKINSDKLQSEYVQKVNDNKDTITLNSINKGEEVTVEVPITMLNEETVKADNFSRVTDVILTANYIDINGNTKAVTKTIKNQVEWSGTAEVENSTQLTKYIPYNVGDEYGVIFQALISNKLKDNAMPVKEQITTVEVPTINETKPEEVKVTVNNSKATNGKENGVDFNQENYTYDQENGKVEIKLENTPSEQNDISWKKNSSDEILINFIYKGKEIYDYVLVEEIKGTLNLNVNMSLYNNAEANVNKDFSYDYTLKDKIGSINTISMSTDENISKGYIYANYDKQDEQTETSYNEKYIIDISYADIENELEINQAIDKFEIDNERNLNTTAGGNNYTYNKNIKIAENIFKKMLGEDGKIEVFKTDNTKIGEINKDTERDNSGRYILDISNEDVNQVIIKTSKPIIEGKIEIEIEKAIKGKQDYSRAQMQSVSSIASEVSLKTTTEEVSSIGNIKMEEPVSKATLSINKTDLSTLVKNENVEIRALLDTSNVYNALYKNPTIEIELPEYIDTIEIKSSKLLFEDELKYKNAELVERDGKKVIRIEFEGTQTKYNTENSEIKGATIVISADITLNKLTPRKNEQIVMYYTNENTDLYEENNISSENAEQNEETYATVRAARATATQEVKGVATASVNYAVPTGVMASAGISNYREGATDVLAITEETEDVEIAPFADQRTATIKGTVTNNLENNISGVSILGRVPVQGTSEIKTTNSLGSNTDFTMSSNISVLGVNSGDVEIYYSENGTATNDVNNQSNGWTASPNDLSKVKSYLIVLKNAISTAGTVEFRYEISIPNNVGYNHNALATYGVYYTNEATEVTTPELREAPILNLTTGEGPELSISIATSAASDAIVFTGQYVRVYVTVKNVGDIDAENAKLVINELTNAKFSYLEDSQLVATSDYEGTIDLGTIKSGESKTVSFEILCQRGLNIEPTEGETGGTEAGEDEEVGEPIVDERLKTINVSVSVEADNIVGGIQSEPYVLTFNEDAKRITINNTVDAYEDLIYKTGDEINYTISVNNKTTSDINNSVLTVPLPNGSNVSDAHIEIDGSTSQDGIDIQSDKVIFNISKIPATTVMKFYVTFTLGENLPDRFSTKVSLTDGEYTYLSNEKYIYTGRISITAEQVEPENPYVKEREGFVYSFRIKANDEIGAENVKLEVTLPQEVLYRSNTVANSETGDIVACREEYNEETRTLTLTIPQIAGGVTLTVNIFVSAELESAEDDGKAITNSAKLYGDNVAEMTLNPVTYYIEYDPDKASGETSSSGYKISGVAWLDSNKNGQRDNDEATLSNVRVMLLYKENNQLVTSSNGENLILTTDDNGKYEFSNLQRNDYLVVFVYDAANYTITTYQKDGVQSSRNSDAISMEVILDGQKTLVGMTDTITINNSNVRNIDIGLYGEEKFDLKLDKYISKITLTTPTIGTSQTEYNNETFTKVEILRQNADKSSIVVEYKIVVTNEGAIPGYVNKIIDYLPDDVTFSSEVNSDWYVANNGEAIYSSALANEKINPGESREITLVLTKRLTKDSLGSIMSNTAEIYEATNEAGMPDMDSEPANKLESEDDFGRADIVLSVVTGKIIGYSIIIIVALGIVVAGIIVIKKKVLNKK